MTVPTFHSYTVLRGRFHAGEYPGAPDEDDARAKVQAMVEAGVQAFIDLTQDGELAPYAHLLPPGIHHERHPIRDVSVPASDAVTQGALDAIERHLAAGRQVYLHCWGGKGRTGTVVGCYLVRHGLVTAARADAIVSAQGVAMGRPSRIHIRIGVSGGDITRVQVGGESVLVGDGRLRSA